MVDSVLETWQTIYGRNVVSCSHHLSAGAFSFLLQFRKLYLPLLLLNQNNIISIFSAGEMPIRKIDNCPAYGGFIRPGNSAELIGRDVVLVERHLSAGLLSFNVVKNYAQPKQHNQLQGAEISQGDS